MSEKQPEGETNEIPARKSRPERRTMEITADAIKDAVKIGVDAATQAFKQANVGENQRDASQVTVLRMVFAVVLAVVFALAGMTGTYLYMKADGSMGSSPKADGVGP